MISLVQKALSLPTALVLILAAGVGALLFALTMQYGLQELPCSLCLWERVPYGAAATLAFIALTWKPYRFQTTVLLGLCLVAFLTDFGLSVYHSGVERQWWELTFGCAATPLAGATPEEVRRALLAAAEPRCDQIGLTIFGLTLTNLNVLYSLGMSLFTSAVIAFRFPHVVKKIPLLAPDSSAVH